MLKSIKNTVKSITGSIAKYWHDISEKARIANEKAKQPRSYSTISPEEKEAQRQKSLDSFNEWFNKYISDMTPYLNSKNEDTCWGSYELVRKFFDEIYHDPATALTYGYAYNDVLDIVHDGIVTLNKNFIKHMKDTFDVDLSDQVADTTGESYFSFGEGLTDIATKFKAKIKATIEQSKKDKADKIQVKKDKKIAGFAKLIDDYIAAMNEFIFADDFNTCAKAYQRALDTIYSYEEDRGLKLAYSDVYEEVIDVLYDKADELHDKVAKHVKDNFDIDIDSEADETIGSGESHMFKRRSGYTTIDPEAFSEMVNILLETERDTLKTFSESKGISYIAESEDYAITSKTLINTTAVVLAARYKFGFYK